MPALEMRVFTPCRRHTRPSGRARARHAARSEPASGSVTAKAASTSPFATAGSQRLFCTSVPTRLSAYEPSPCIANAVSASDEKYASVSRTATSERRSIVPNGGATAAGSTLCSARIRASSRVRAAGSASSWEAARRCLSPKARTRSASFRCHSSKKGSFI